MVQNGEGYTPDQYGKDVTGTMSNPADTPRDNYDFTFAIESDTQYYNEDLMVIQFRMLMETINISSIFIIGY